MKKRLLQKARIHLRNAHRDYNRTFIIGLSIFVGLLSGLSAILLKNGVFFMRSFLLDETSFDLANYFLLILPSIGIAFTLVFKKFLIKDMIKHNIASILHSIAKRGSIMKFHKVFSSLVGGILTAGFGGSVGLESPIISTGAAIGSNLSRSLKLDYKTTTLILACGSSSAIAAIFSTPIAGIVFALEVLLIDLTSFSLLPLLVASVTGVLITKIFTNPEVLFDFIVIKKFTVSEIPLVIVFGFLTGIGSTYFSKVYMYIQNKFAKIKNLWTRLLVGSVILGILIFIFPPLFGEGFNTIRNILEGNFLNIIDDSIFHSLDKNIFIIIAFFSMLILLKVIATSVTIGAGGIGGIFAPSLFTGSILGFLFAHIVNLLNIGIHLSEINYALIGMAGMLGGVLQAPLTGMFIIIEITIGYELVIPLMLSTVVSYLTTKYIDTNSIFTKQLALSGSLITHHKDKAVLKLIDLAEIIDIDFNTVDINANLGDLVEIIKKAHRNNFPVINKQNDLLGVIALDKIREIMFDQSKYQKVTVRNLMIQLPMVIQMEDTVESVADKFIKTGVWNLAVVENGKYVGFVSKSKLFSVYRKMLVDISSD